MKRILVTGGAGFVGSHLCDRLIEDGHQVICLDNFYTGSRSNIEHLIGHPRFYLRRHDVCDPIDLVIDEIYNLACPASPPFYQRDPVKTLQTSVQGALNLLVLAQRTGARILQASTSEVYGEPQEHPQREEYWGNVNPNGIRSCYDEGKRCAETLFFDYHRQFGTSIKVARIFNTYGPRMSEHDGRVVSNFVSQALRGESLTVFGNGGQTRSFCYVDDLIEGLIRLMNSDSSIIGPINLGNPTERSVRDLAELVLSATCSSTPIVERELPSDDPTRRRPDISRAKDLLDWSPKVSLETGLGKTIDWFKLIITMDSERSDLAV